ncbi:alpha/beta hydrolase fold domain-containing protein [Flavobacterium sp.]|uniref:alpha/beta hydrolase fold domain-containing protein n=1 Tax=Flavobacterium sp. TaxID=239 RepID=UPI00391AEF25
MVKYLILAFFCLFNKGLFSQIQKDTSYTVLSTFNKEKVKFPFIKVVQEKNKDKVLSLKDLVFKNTDSRAFYLDAYYKIQDSLQPVVLLIHGGGWKSGDKSQMQFLAQEIASKGYACFNIEYRLSDEAKYPAAVIDVKTAIKYIKANASKFNIDINKVAVLGCSSGGQMAALIGTTNGNELFEEQTNFKQNSNVQAIVNIDGILAFHHQESKEGKVAALWLDGTYEENPQNWNEASALTHCNENTPPILFINSDMPRFHAGRDDMIAILSKFGIYTEIKTITHSPHSFWFFHPWFDEIVNSTTQFLDKILKQK